MRVSWVTKQELKAIVDKVPVNELVTVIVGRWGWTRRFPVGRLSRPVWHGEYSVSFYWTDGKYMEYVWITDSKNMDSIVEVIKENS